MTKYKGHIGYSVQEEIRPGVWGQPFVRECMFYGDVIEPYIRHDQSDNVNDDLKIANTISILVDPKSFKHASNMRYLEYMGSRWKITGFQTRYPRIILTLGGVYNGPIPDEDYL